MECWLRKWKKLSNLSNNSGQRSRKWLTILTLWTQSPINWILTGTPIIVKGVVDCAVSESAALGRGEEYLKTKIHILKQEVENRYQVVKDQFESKAFTTESYLQDALKKLEKRKSLRSLLLRNCSGSCLISTEMNLICMRNGNRSSLV